MKAGKKIEAKLQSRIKNMPVALPGGKYKYHKPGSQNLRNQ